MANTQQLKRRIGSVKNTKQITKAMELVAASKMRRAQEYALKSREFRRLARQILTRLSELTDVSKHPLYVQRDVKHRLHILITGDRGLAGAYNSNIFKQFTVELRQDLSNQVKSSVIVIGRKGARFVSKLEGVNVVAVYEQFPEQPTAQDIRPILHTAIDHYTNETVDAVDVIYTDYRSSISQVVETERILPAVFREVKISPDLEAAIVEPSPEIVLEQITERLVEVQLSQVFSESLASEHSSRMIAMKNASDNAGDLINDLTLAFNTARQASITQELAEITAGAEAIN
ncbi:ATP synthase F1 subunit gamma [soil metagenome]